ncbi:MAG: carbohydrate-binding family 9-like protein, partial [Candidatus Omnitrophica bacterium]|nr:carbohydrate-binding family 9-like protein [Candidatus Omnitrophota bacterium]
MRGLKKVLSFLPVFLVVFPFCLQAAAYQCPKATGKIIIDGKLIEDDWKKAPVIKLFDIVSGQLPSFRSEPRVIWDEQFLYVAAFFQETNVWATVDLKRRYGAPLVFPRNESEIMGSDTFLKAIFDPDADERNYVEFHVNPFNSLFDCFFTRGKDSLQNQPPDRVYHYEWSCPGVISAVNIEGTLNDLTDRDTGWSVELAIPWTSLKPFMRTFPVKPGDIWKAHLGRVWRSGPYAERVYWTWPVMGIVDCHIPSKWQTMEFVTSLVEKKKEKIWRGGWTGALKDQQKLLSFAKKLGFTALMINAPPNYLNELIPKANSQGIEIYYWFHILGQKENQEWWQKVSLEEEEK